MGRRLLTIVLFASLLTGVFARPAHAEIIDRILAVVSGQIITKSDLDTALTFGIIGKADDPLQALIDRFLMLNEVRRVAPPSPPPAAVERRLVEMRSNAGGGTKLADALALTGMTEAVLKIFAEDDVTLAAYLDERFSAAAQPSDQEILQIGEANRQRLAAERKQGLIAAWVAELRRRAEISILQ